MNEYQKCPVCDGHGYVPYPEGVAVGMPFSTTSTGPWPCRRCSSQGTIQKPLVMEIRDLGTIEFNDGMDD